MSLFASRLNKTLAVHGRTKTGTDGGGQPIYADVVKGTVAGRIDPRGGRGRDATEVVNGPDLNPVVSDFLAVTALPVGFEMEERDTLVDDIAVFEVLGVATLDGPVSAHHLELALRKVSA